MYSKFWIRLCVLCVFCALCVGKARAQMTTFDWDVLRIDSMLPVYTEVVPLESDYRMYDYRVAVEYPEWAELTTSEVRRVERIGRPIGEELHICSNVSISRKKGMLDIAFCPLVKRDGRYFKLLSAAITITPVEKAQEEELGVRGEGVKNEGVKSEGLRVKALGAPAERYARQSVLAEGKWVKISIAEDGMYRLTRSAIKSMGFAHPDNVRLYGHGGHRLSEVSNPATEYDDLEEVPLYKAGADTWLFWGNGVLYWNGNTRVINPYATKGCYFLTEAEEPAAMDTLASTSAPLATYNSFPDHVLYEKDEYAWFHGGRNLYDNVNYANGNSHTYKLTTTNSLGDERLAVVFTAAASTSTELATTVNGTPLGTTTISELSSYTYAMQSSRTMDVSSYANGAEWTIRLTTTAGNPARLDYLALHYTRALKPDQGFVAFSAPTSGAAQFDIAGTGLQVMRIGEPGEPACLVQGRQQGDTLSVDVDDASRRYVAFDPTYAFPQPTVAGTVENQNLHALDSLDMVIIIPTSNKLKAAAERLAEAHRQYQGLRTAVVRADQVYNEFSSGTPDATAYRRLMKMLYDRALSDDVAPRYLLLFGDCAWDNRMLSAAWRNYSPDDFLLCYESENSLSDIKCYVMEDYFGLLDDGEGKRMTTDKTDLGVGRFPVTNVADADVMVQKTIAHLTNDNAGSWKNIVCFLGDDGDENDHLEKADEVAEGVVKDNPEMEVRKIMWDAYPRVSTLTSNTYPEVTRLVKEQMDEGALVMNYTGHAATYCFSHELVIKLEDFAAYQGTKLPIWVAAACDVMPFDGLVENMGETAVLNPKGNAVAFFSTARTVYASQNLYMNQWFMHYLLATDGEGRRYRVGDAVRLAKNHLIDDSIELSENKLHYALLGDPALTFGAPTNRVRLDSINGLPLSADEPMQLQAGQQVRMVGHIENAQGDSLTAFDGILSARVYDNLETITCKNNAGASTPFRFTTREKVLFNGQDSVTCGRFAISFVVPVDINFSNEAGRAVFYAITNERGAEANGYSEDFTVGGINPTADDTQGPDIFAYLNNEDFENGDHVNTTPYFVAQLHDDSGINYSGIGLGHDLQLTIDGDASKTYTLNDSYTSEFGDHTRGTVAFSIPQLAPGTHQLVFRAWDVLNNTSAATLDFLVDASVKPVMLNLTASQNPALASTSFIVSYNLPGTDCDLLIEVFDFAGRILWSSRQTANSGTGQYSVPWNLTTNAGTRLGAGVYLYRATMRNGNSKKVSKTQKIVIHGNN